MADPFVAEIRIYGFNFAPRGWAFCDGQLLPISQNTALFSLLGTTYGGDGKSTFMLPNLQGMSPMSQGQGPGLSDRFLGESSGSEQITLLQTEMPNHPHTLQASRAEGGAREAVGSLSAAGVGGIVQYAAPVGPNKLCSPQAVSFAGGDQAHNNLMPYLTLNFCVALQGVFPARP
jgi:microcystin-dependent protein